MNINLNQNVTNFSSPLSPMRHRNSPEKPSSNLRLMGPAAQYIDAVTAVYSPTASQANKTQANTWLQNFSTSKAAWSVCQQIITTTTGPVPTTAIMFFTLNILYNKIKREWVSVPANQKQVITSSLFKLSRDISHSSSSNNNNNNNNNNNASFEHMDNNSISRLCLCLCSIASFQPNGVEIIAQMAMELFQQVPRGLLISLESLVSIIDEVKETDPVRAQSLELELQIKQQLPNISKLLNHLLTNDESPISLKYILHNHSVQTPTNISRETFHVTKIALKALQRWVENGISLSILYENYNSLYILLKEMVLNGPRQFLEHTINVFTASLSVQTYPPGNSQQNAMNDLCLLCINTRPIVEKALNEEDEQICMEMCKLCSAVGESGVDVIATGKGELINFVQILFQFLQCKFRDVALITMDFWANLCDIEVANRHPYLRHDAFVEIIKTVTIQSMFDLDELYGSNFTSWEEYCEPSSPTASQKQIKDETDWSRNDTKFGPFRQDGKMEELLNFSSNLLRDKFYETILSIVIEYGTKLSNNNGDKENNWRYIEAALYTIHLVGTETSRNLNDKGYVEQKPAVADRIATYLQQLFNELTNNKLYLSNPLLIQTGCKIFASHIKFIKNGYHKRLPQIIDSQALMKNALTYICNALMIQGARMEASRALRKVCNALERELGNRDTMSHLVTVLMQAIEKGIPSEGRKNLVDAFIRIGLSIIDINTSKICFDSIINPFVNDLKEKLQKYSATGANTEHAVDLINGISDDLSILYAGIKHLDRVKNEKTQQIAGTFVQTMWPILIGLIKNLFNHNNILRPSLDLMSRIVRSFGVQMMGPQFMELMNLLKEAYKYHVSDYEIITAKTLMEEFYKTHAPVFVDFLLYICINTDSKIFNDVNSYPQIIASMFEYASRSLIFCKVQMESNTAVIDQIFQKAIICAGQGQEKDSTRSVLNFMKQVIKPVRSGANRSVLSDRVMSTQSSQLINVELQCITETSPDFMLPYHADLLYNIATGYTQVFTQALNVFMSNYQNMQYLKPETKQLIVIVLPLLSNGQFENKKKFKEFLLDLSSVCRGEKQIDLLLPYRQLVGV